MSRREEGLAEDMDEDEEGYEDDEQDEPPGPRSAAPGRGGAGREPIGPQFFGGLAAPGGLMPGESPLPAMMKRRRAPPGVKLGGTGTGTSRLLAELGAGGGGGAGGGAAPAAPAPAAPAPVRPSAPSVSVSAAVAAAGAGAAPLAPPMPAWLEAAHASLVRALDGTLLFPKHNAPERIDACLSTLITLLTNAQREGEGSDKFRAIRLGNAAFQSRVASTRGGEDFLYACGWRKEVIAQEPLLTIDAGERPRAVLAAAVDLCERRLANQREKAARAAAAAEAAREDERRRKERAQAGLKEDQQRRREQFAAAKAAATAAEAEAPK